MPDPMKALADISGIPIAEIQDLATQVMENHRRLNGCARHTFGVVKLITGNTITRLAVCSACGGEMRLGDIRLYVAGYIAHGGDAADIWTLEK